MTPAGDDYLCLSTPLVRYLDVPEPRRPLTVTPPLQILAMVARPHDLDPLNTEHEQRRLDRSPASPRAVRAGAAALGGRADLVGPAGRPGPGRLAHLPLHRPRRLRYPKRRRCAGPGRGGRRGAPARRQRPGPAPARAPLAAAGGAQLLRHRPGQRHRPVLQHRLGPDAAGHPGRGGHAVRDLRSEAAIAFARGFYTALAAQHPVDQAVTRARRAIKLARQNTLEWATPVLYLRSPTGALFDLTDIPATPASPPPDTRQPAPAEAAPPPPPEEPPAPAPAARPPSQVPPAPLKRLETRPTELTRAAPRRRRWRVRWRSARTGPGWPPPAATARPGSGTWPAASSWPELRHGGWMAGVFAVAFSPDGTRLATGCGGIHGTARIWDLASGQQLTQLSPR